MRNANKYIILVLSLILSINVYGQKSVSLGDKYYKNFDFINAIDEYLKVVSDEPDNLAAVRGLAFSYKNLGNNIKSEYWFEKLVKLEPSNNENLYYYSKALMGAKKYDKSLAKWNEYRSLTNEQHVSTIIDGFDYISKLESPNPNVELKNAVNLNSSASDFGASYVNTSEITFCSTRPESEGEQDKWTHQKYTDLYTSVVAYESQSAPIKFKDDQYNGMYHDGPATFTEENIMYLTRSQYVGSKTTQSKGDNTVKLELVEVDLNNDSKKYKDYAKRFDFNDREYSVAHATVSQDGNFMIFASDAESFGEHYGATDLYYIEKSDSGLWSSPKSLGSVINTHGDEEYPFLADDKTLYFASDGHYGIGGLDIYKTELTSEGTWKEPENIGAPFNTSFDDFNYIFDKNSNLGFLTSDRPGGLGYDDIYVFKYQEGKIPGKDANIEVKFIVYDEETLMPIEKATVEVPLCAEDQYFSDERGKGIMDIDAYSTCELVAMSDGYFPKTVPFSVFDKDVEIEVPMRKIKKEKCTLSVCVREQNTDKPIADADIKLYSKIDNRYYTAVTDMEGCAQFVGIQPNVDYEIVAGKTTGGGPTSGYLSTSSKLSTGNITCPTTLNQVMYLRYAETGVGIEIPEIFYDLDKYYIRPDAAIQLDKIVKVLIDNPTIHIELGSHTDCRASYAYNEKLSTNRAKSAVEYIVSRGISASRLTWKGYGESQLRTNCPCEGAVKSSCSEYEHQQNRRTEFKITKW